MTDRFRDADDRFRDVSPDRFRDEDWGVTGKEIQITFSAKRIVATFSRKYLAATFTSKRLVMTASAVVA